MNILNKTAFQWLRNIGMASLLATSSYAVASSSQTVIDDFSDAKANSLGLERLYMNDTMAGGGTKTDIQVEQGILRVKGEIVPPRGQPGWASSVLPLAQMGSAKDASQFKGIQVRVRLHSGNLSLFANSNEITNFDYHAAPIVVTSDGDFHDISIPFESMKRAWSEQTELNTATLNSLSIVAYSIQNDVFDFEVEKVSFY